VPIESQVPPASRQVSAAWTVSVADSPFFLSLMPENLSLLFRSGNSPCYGIADP